MLKYFISFLLFLFVFFNELFFNVVILIILLLKVRGLGCGGGGYGYVLLMYMMFKKFYFLLLCIIN